VTGGFPVGPAIGEDVDGPEPSGLGRAPSSKAPAGQGTSAATGDLARVQPLIPASAEVLAWQVPSGRYQASVTLSASGPVNVEVWDDTGDALLARRMLPATNGVESISLPVDATTAHPAQLFHGWGPFRACLPGCPHPGGS
jgi:hypothetical protein